MADTVTPGQESNFYNLMGMPDNNPWNFLPKPLPYQSAWNPSMSLVPAAQQAAGSYQVNQAPIRAIEQNAFSPSQSPWAMLQSNALRQQVGMARGQLAGQAAGGLATARSALASQGGLATGARERLAQSGFRNFLNNQQQLSQQGIQGQQGIMAQDAAQKMQQQQALIPAEYQYAQGQFAANQLPLQATQFDIGQQINEATRKNAYDLANYSEQNKAIAAKLQGQATASSGGKK